MAKDEYEALEEAERQELIHAHQAPVVLTPEAPENTAEDVAPVLQTIQPALFENKYEAEGSLKLLAWKQMMGRSLTEDEFTFELVRLGEDGEIEVLQTKTNAADGTIAFDPLEYNQDDIGHQYFYGVREVTGSDDTVIYDESMFGYNVVVYDNGDGTLSFSQTHAGAVFEDVACPDGTHVEPATAQAQPDGFVLGPDADAVTLFREQGFADSALAAAPLDGEAVYGTYEVTAAKLIEAGIPEEDATAYTVRPVESMTFVSMDEQVIAKLAQAAGVSGDYTFVKAVVSMTVDEEQVSADGVGVNVTCNLTFADSLCKGEGTYRKLTGWDVTAGELPLFTNRLKSGQLTVTKLTKWTEGSEPDPDQEFHFKVKIIAPGGVPFDPGDDYEYIPEQVENIGAVSASSDPSQGETEGPTETGETDAPTGGGEG